MTIDPQPFERLLSAFDLEALFNELGWDYPVMGPQQIQADGEAFTLTPVAQKRGVAVLRCSPDSDGRVPPRPQLLRIEQDAAKISHEHLLVFAVAAQSPQTWLWVMRAPGQPTVTRSHS